MAQTEIQTYLDMIRSIPPQLPAIRLGDRFCTYGELAEAAEQIRQEQKVNHREATQKTTQKTMHPEQLSERSELKNADGTASSSRTLFVIRDSAAVETNNQNALAGHQPTESISHKKKIHSDQNRSILQSLLEFLALSGTEKIPVIVPADATLSSTLLSTAIPPKACMAVMTSGTTGEGRLLFRTFESWYNYFPIQNQIFSMGRDCRIFMQGSLAFTGNFNLCMALLSTGGVILAEKIFDPRLWMRRIEAENANTIYLIPTKLRALERAYAKAGIINHSVRMIISGSQSLGRQDADALKAIFPNAEIILYYGASELNYITYIRDREMGSDQTLIGRPFPDVQVRVSDGRLLVTTRYGVIGTPEDAFIGDYGHRDAQGLFYFDGRKDDICNLNGRKVSSWRVEQAILALDGVAEAAVKPVFLDGRDHLAAWVVLNPGEKWTKIQLREALQKKLSAAEIPKYITFADELPKTDSGKIRKNQIALRADRSGNNGSFPA